MSFSTYEDFKEITDNSVVYDYTKRPMDENSFQVSSKIYSPSYTINPQDGDIYIRFNKSNGNVRVHVFNGRRSKYYDQDFGAGEETFGCTYVDISLLVDYLIENKMWSVLRSMNDVAKKVGLSVVNGPGWD